MIPNNTWVRLEYRYDDGIRNTIELLIHTSDTMYRFDSKVDGRNSATKDRANLTVWRPNIGEWCWFWNGDEHPVVRMSEGVSDRKHYPFPAVYNDMFREQNYEKCIPFRGYLPKKLKENK